MAGRVTGQRDRADNKLYRAPATGRLKAATRQCGADVGVATLQWIADVGVTTLSCTADIGETTLASSVLRTSGGPTDTMRTSG